jgi:membrane-associated phospholipid phosphatase
MTAPMSTSSPGRAQFGASVERFDRRGDQVLEHLRGTRADALLRAASEIGDFSLIWHGINLTRGIAVRRPDQVLGLAVALGLESLLVNQGIKRLFRRQRPTVDGDARTPVRRPATSSFPSGHASAAAFNATILSTWDRKRAPLWWSLAAIVGISRAHVRIHHLSDVVGGLIIGVALGTVAGRLLRRLGIAA